jgi:hypothetical protein
VHRQTKLHIEQFGVSQIRMLTITDSAKRFDKMLNAVNEISAGKGSNFFLAQLGTPAASNRTQNFKQGPRRYRDPGVIQKPPFSPSARAIP